MTQDLDLERLDVKGHLFWPESRQLIRTRPGKVTKMRRILIRLLSTQSRVFFAFLFCLYLSIACTTPYPQQTPVAVNTLAPTLLPSATLTKPVPTLQRPPTNTPTSTPAPKSTQIVTPPALPLATMSMEKVQFIVRGRDSVDASASILTRLLDKNFATIAEYHNLKGYLSLSLDGNVLRDVTYNTSKGFNITEINLLTLQAIKSVALGGSELTPHGQSFDYQLSPDKKWIAYKKISTEDKFAPWDAEFQDVMLMKVDFTVPQKPLQITEHGWAKPAFLAWSPDGRYLTFTDMDNLGRIQIYLYDVQIQQKIQVSNFKDSSNQVEVGEFAWRQDGGSIAFYRSIYAEKQIQINPNERIGVVSLADFSTHWVGISVFQDLYSHKNIIWNAAGTQFVLVIDKSSTEMSQLSQSLLWINPEQNTGEIVTIPQENIQDVDFRPLQICNPFLFDEMTVGLIADGALVLYNHTDASNTLYTLKPLFDCAEILVIP